MGHRIGRIFNGPRDVTGEYVEGPTTKRHVLQATTTFNDSLGLLSPVSFIGKLLFHDTRCKELDWDEILPSDLGALWNTRVSTLPHLAHLRIPRWEGTADRSHPQVFCDAFQLAYEAAVYIRSCKGRRPRGSLSMQQEPTCSVEGGNLSKIRAFGSTGRS